MSMEHPNAVRILCVWKFLTFWPRHSTRASRHSSVHVFDISAAKSAPTLRYFWHFDFEMCFVPQLRAIFQQFNTSKCASHHSRAHFFNSLSSKSAQTMRCFDLFTWKYVSHHSSLQFLISHPTRWLGTHCFSEPTSRPSGVTQHRQNTVFCALCYSFVFVSLSLSLSLPLSLYLSFLWLFTLWSSFFLLPLLWLFPPLLPHLSKSRKFEFQTSFTCCYVATLSLSNAHVNIR